MDLTSESIDNGQPIAEEFAFGKIDPEAHMALGPNRNPQLAWSGVPDGVKSFALVCVDPDVPADATDVNQEDKSLPADAGRVDFYHWALVDMPAEQRAIDAGAYAEGVTARGKADPAGPPGSRQGLNGFTGFLAGSDMEGEYFGYDGPCPPWNDERMHHYHFRLLALDVARLDVAGRFSGDDVLKAAEGHVLAEAEIMGTYTLNPDLR